MHAATGKVSPRFGGLRINPIFTNIFPATLLFCLNRMGKYSIKELERLSGIKAHTIRMWEKRHNLIAPDRTDTNIRLYSDDDLKKIINVSLLNSKGLKISKIVDLSAEELTQKVHELSEGTDPMNVYIDQLVVTMVDLEEEAFENLLAKFTLKFGFEKTVTEIIYPFLEKIGILWQTGNISPAQEHFISNLVRQKIIVAIDALPHPPKTATRALLFLPEHELHEIGLLYHQYITRHNGFRTFYLGQAVPYDNLKQVYETHLPRFLITSLTSYPPPKEMQAFVDRLATDFKTSVILATGSAIRKMALKFPPNFHVFDTTLKLKELLVQYR
jgi:MerR family transcriptional regulator, light-induced transcriptional regulator